ncbi:hypothetical protein BDQ12DRAFT_672126, partial [Crucibulum laeve]
SLGSPVSLPAINHSQVEDQSTPDRQHSVPADIAARLYTAADSNPGDNRNEKLDIEMAYLTAVGSQNKDNFTDYMQSPPSSPVRPMFSLVPATFLQAHTSSLLKDVNQNVGASTVLPPFHFGEFAVSLCPQLSPSLEPVGALPTLLRNDNESVSKLTNWEWMVDMPADTDMLCLLDNGTW